MMTIRNNFFATSLVSVVLYVMMGSAAHAQWYTGMSKKTGLALCIHLDDSTAELYSPLQSSEPIPVSSWGLENGLLTIECKSIGLKMNLTRNDSIFSGYWKQGLVKEDITFFPADSIFRLNRPQTPQQPYRFDEETVTADYTDSQGNTVHLEGTLSYPKGGKRYPTIVLVSGSGQQNRDEELFQHKPFLVLADYLSSRGIAVLRYDDRGMGASTGALDSADTRLFAEDAEMMFNAVKGNAHVDPKCIGIGGHSEGGAIAPMVAARNKEVKFVVMLAGQGCTGLDVLLQQNEAIFRANGMSDSLLAIRMACMRELFGLAFGSSQKEYKAVIDRHTGGLTKEQVELIGLGRGTAFAFKQQFDSRWMQTFLSLDPAEYLPKVSCPIFALQGAKDCQVLAEPNIAAITRLAGKRVKHEVFTGLNHLFQHCSTGSPDEYMLIEETFAPEAMKAIADWILEN